MVSTSFKPAVTRVIEPIARLLSRIGITPDAVTVFGTVGSIAASLYFYIGDKLFIGTLVITLFVLSDLFDGAIARVSSRGPSTWGAFLDSTCDRLTDAAILSALSVHLILEEDSLTPVVLASIVVGSLVPYIRAKAESFNISCTVGVAERTERLIIVLVGAGLDGLGVPYALAIGMWLLLVLGVITVLQRVWVVRKGLLQS
jgi:CDP-diacylglycerol--glycerol-3-phosphate 3-phosphatidyltransferase